MTVDAGNILAGLRKRGRKLSKHPDAILSRKRRAKESRRLKREDKKNESRVSSEWLGARGEGESMDPATPDRAERAITTGRHDHHIASDGSRQPGLNLPSSDQALDKKLAELHHLVSRMEVLAAIVPGGRGAAEYSINTDKVAFGLTLPGDAPKDRGLVDGAGARVRRLINIVEHIRAIVGAKGELLFGASPSESKGTALDKTSSAAGVHALFSGLDHLDIQVECLEHEVVSLLGQL